MLMYIFPFTLLHFTVEDKHLHFFNVAICLSSAPRAFIKVLWAPLCLKSSGHSDNRTFFSKELIFPFSCVQSSKGLLSYFLEFIHTFSKSYPTSVEADLVTRFLQRHSELGLLSFVIVEPIGTVCPLSTVAQSLLRDVQGSVNIQSVSCTLWLG